MIVNKIHTSVQSLILFYRLSSPRHFVVNLPILRQLWFSEMFILIKFNFVGASVLGCFAQLFWLVLSMI